MFAQILFVVLRTTNYKEDLKTDKNISEEQIARLAKALGHPTRITILRFLAAQNSCYFGDIHDELPIAKATVSQHLKELKEAGLIQGEIETPRVKYCLNRENLQIAHDLFDAFFDDCSQK